jgi:hypothetical protein
MLSIFHTGPTGQRSVRLINIFLFPFNPRCVIKMKLKKFNNVQSCPWFCVFHQYRQGASLRQLSRDYGVSTTTIKTRLIKEGIPVRVKNIVRGLNSSSHLLKGLYLGAWAGDGTQFYDAGYCIKLCCHSNNKEMIAFFQRLLLKLFNKKSSVRYEERHRAMIRFYSRYIYDFVSQYLSFARQKTYTVSLKNEICSYSNNFLMGYFLGLMLTDGYLKRVLTFNSTSPKLAKDMFELLLYFGFSPKFYLHKRKKYGWKDLNMINLNKKESFKADKLLDKIIEKTKLGKSFALLKGYEPGEI